MTCLERREIQVNYDLIMKLSNSFRLDLEIIDHSFLLPSIQPSSDQKRNKSRRNRLEKQYESRKKRIKN
jgi:hypothetical protein